MEFSEGKLTVTGPTATANIFATYLPQHMTLWRGFLDEVSGPGWVSLFKRPPHRNGPAGSPSQWRVREFWMGTMPRHLCQGFEPGALLRPCGLTRSPRWLPWHLLPR